MELLRPELPRELGAIVQTMMAKQPAERYQTPDELMDALAPYAAPATADWQIAPSSAPKSSTDLGNEDNVSLADVQSDTEPRAQSSTRISDEDSILDWVDVNRKQRQFVRRAIVTTVLLTLGVALVGGAALLWWCMQ